MESVPPLRTPRQIVLMVGHRLRGLNERTSCTRRNTTIHKQSLPCDVPAGLRRKEYNGPIQILQLARTFQRNPIAKIFDPFFVLVQNFVLLCPKPSRSKTIHRHAELAPVIGQTHRQLLNAAPARSIRPKTRVTSNRGNGTNVDNPPIAPGDHSARHSLSDKEAAAKISFEN